MWPRACVIRGKLTAVRRGAARVHLDERAPVASLTLELEPADDPGCVTPLDQAAGGLAEPEAGFADKVVATRVELVGSGRLEPELRAGRALCGWAKGSSNRPVYGPPRRWEGQLSDADHTLLLAASGYLEPSTSRMLARPFRFARQGAATRHPIPEGGAFVEHHRVKVSYQGRSIVVDEEGGLLPLPDGKHLAIQAASLLTEGPVPVFTGRWDGFAFSALRVP